MFDRQTRHDNEALRQRKIQEGMDDVEEDLRLMRLYTEIEEKRVQQRADMMAERQRLQALKQRGYEKNEGEERRIRDLNESKRLLRQQAEKDQLALTRIRQDKHDRRQRQVRCVLHSRNR